MNSNIPACTNKGKKKIKAQIETIYEIKMV